MPLFSLLSPVQSNSYGLESERASAAHGCAAECNKRPIDCREFLRLDPSAACYLQSPFVTPVHSIVRAATLIGRCATCLKLQIEIQKSSALSLPRRFSRPYIQSRRDMKLRPSPVPAYQHDELNIPQRTTRHASRTTCHALRPLEPTLAAIFLASHLGKARQTPPARAPGRT